MPPSEVNYDEAKVPPYSLPDPLTMASGEPVADAATWPEVRRPEILQLFKTHVFGEMPGPLSSIRFLTTDETAYTTFTIFTLYLPSTMRRFDDAIEGIWKTEFA